MLKFATLYKAIAIGLIFIIAAYFSIKSLDKFLFTTMEETVIVIIPKDLSTYAIGELLVQNRVIKNKPLFVIWAKLESILRSKHIIAGEYQFDQGMTPSDIIAKVTSGSVIIRKITIPEGKNIFEALDIITGSYGINLTNYKCRHAICPHMKLQEGSILPDTYFYQYGMQPSDILKRARDAMDYFLNAAWANRDQAIDDIIRDKNEAIILASIIEKEASINEEKPIISSVYLNRLRSSMRLQADPTVLYGIELEKQKKMNFLSSDDLNHHSPYNTYQNLGLPPTPICNPSRMSILAVLHPAKTQFLYFVADGKGGHRFAAQYQEHTENVKLYRQAKSYLKLKEGFQNNDQQ